MNDLTGTNLGQYQVIEYLRDTGSSRIYKGFQPNMNRFVTLQVLKAQDPVALQAFQGQNELLVRIQGANILPILDSSMADGTAYRVLQYAEGGVLQAQVFAYYDLRKAAGLLASVAAGLETVHAQGVVHGNLGSDRIYLDEMGRALLTDYGLPPMLRGSLSAGSGDAYLSPEQVQGGIVDRRADVYALGVLLYELLTGELPPPGMVVSPRAKRSDIPEGVEKVIYKAMAQNPDARFQSAREFQNALNGAVQPVVPAPVPPPTPQPQPAPPGPAGPPPPAPQRTNWTAVVLSITLFILICGGLGLLLGWWNSRDVEIPPVEPTAPPAEIVPTEAPEDPTREPRPTRTPRPTREPGETEAPPEVENPIEPAPDGPDEVEPGVPGICSAGGFAGGFFVLGTFLMLGKRPRTHNKKKKDSPSLEQ